MVTTNLDIKESLVICHGAQGGDVRGSLVRLTSESAVFEIYNPAVVLRMSDVLHGFKITAGESIIYSGRAVITNLVNASTVLICEVKLDDAGHHLTPLSSSLRSGVPLKQHFEQFLSGWQSLYRIRPDFKEAMADFQSFLSDLRLWLDQVELEIRSSPSANRFEMERKVIVDLLEPIGSSIDAFIERFESIAAKVEPELRAAHRTYLRRQLHPLLLCSPFAYRSFQKPLGYAGDYEIVDMMLRPPYEGASLFAKTINAWLLTQAPAAAHRNRVDYLKRKLTEETARAQRLGRCARIYSLGCGPAAEAEEFLKEQALSDWAEFTFLDFNEETLTHLRMKLERVRQQQGRRTPTQFVKKSVQQLLKDSGKSVARAGDSQQDFVYCAGLFDYLADNVCKRLTGLFYDMLAPGGLLVLTNVTDALNDSRPFRHSMEYILDWHLIYRNGQQFEKLAHAMVPDGSWRVISEESGVNVLLEIRKPNDA